MSFFNAAQKPIVSVTDFIKSNTSNGVKYSAVANEMHKLYFPYQEINGVKTIIAVAANVHDIHVSPEKYESCVCLSGVVRKDENTGVILNDGTCPFCERLGDAYSIKSYREELALVGVQKTGKELEDYKNSLSRQYASEMKISKAKPKAYVLVAKFTMDANGNPTLNNGVPVYELKVMALSTNRLNDFSELFKAAGMDMAGHDLSIKYPNTKDARLLVTQAITMPCFGPTSIVTSYPAVIEKIQAEVKEFNWAVLETSFPEWKGMTNEQATVKCATMFNAWDIYVEEKKHNPNAKYLEYSNQTQTPALETSAPVATPAPAPAPAPAVAPAPAPAMPNPAVGNGFPPMGDMSAIFGNMKL